MSYGGNYSDFRLDDSVRRRGHCRVELRNPAAQAHMAGTHHPSSVFVLMDLGSEHRDGVAADNATLLQNATIVAAIHWAAY